MKRRDFLGLGLAPVILASPVLASAALASPTRAAPVSTDQEIPKTAWASRAARSGFLPNVPLVTHTGQHVRFYDDLVREKIVLLNFFMVGCTDGRCPTATANLRKVQDLLGDRMGRDIFFLSISLQPKLDTPIILKEYAENFSIKPGWTFLTGKPADIEHLRRSLGYAEDDPEIDKDPANHVGMARYGDDRLERWGAVSLNSKPSNIASTFKWLSI